MKRYSAKEKHEVIMRYQKGEKIAHISKTTNIARSTIYLWLNEIELPVTDLKQKVTLREYNKLKCKLNKYQNMIHILQHSGCSVYAPLKERLAVMETLYGQYEVHTL